VIKLKKYLLVFGLITFLLFASFTNAQVEGPVDLLIDSPQENQEEPINLVDEAKSVTVDLQEELIEPGLLPNHPLYFLKSISERLGNLFAFGQINRAQRAMALAEKRLAEANALMAQGETELAQQIMNQHQEQFSHAFTFAQKAKEAGQNTDEVMAKIAENTLRHQAVLFRVYEQAPEEAKGAIEQAMENSLRGHQQALEAISQEKSEEVDQILERIEKRRPAMKERTNQFPEQEENNQNLLEIKEQNQENSLQKIQTGDDQAGGQENLIQIQEQAQEKTQERTPVINQQ